MPEAVRVFMAISVAVIRSQESLLPEGDLCRFRLILLFAAFTPASEVVSPAHLQSRAMACSDVLPAKSSLRRGRVHALATV